MSDYKVEQFLVVARFDTTIRYITCMLTHHTIALPDQLVHLLEHCWMELKSHRSALDLVPQLLQEI